MKLIISAIFLSLTCALHALSPEEFRAQETQYLAQVQRVYAQAMQDESFLVALDEARNAAEANRDPILLSPDWPVKLVERVYASHYGGSSNKEQSWEKLEAAYIEQAKAKYAKVLHWQSFRDAFEAHKAHAERTQDLALQKPDWFLVICDRAYNQLVHEKEKAEQAEADVQYERDTDIKMTAAQRSKICHALRRAGIIKTIAAADQWTDRELLAIYNDLQSKQELDRLNRNLDRLNDAINRIPRY